MCEPTSWGLPKSGHQRSTAWASVPATTVLVGDTPRDVRAGLDGGAHVVAVASGSDDMDSLRKEGADVVLPDLRDTQAVVHAVTQFRGQAAQDASPS